MKWLKLVIFLATFVAAGTNLANAAGRFWPVEQMSTINTCLSGACLVTLILFGPKFGHIATIIAVILSAGILIIPNAWFGNMTIWLVIIHSFANGAAAMGITINNTEAEG